MYMLLSQKVTNMSSHLVASKVWKLFYLKFRPIKISNTYDNCDLNHLP